MSLRPASCEQCGAPVLRVPIAGTTAPISLEDCVRVDGDWAIQIGLLGCDPTAVKVASGTSTYRVHQCPRGHRRSALSFTGAAPKGKRRT